MDLENARAQLEVFRRLSLGQELGQDLEPRRPAKRPNVGVDVKTVRILRENLHLVSERSVDVLPTWMILFHGACIGLSKTTSKPLRIIQTTVPQEGSVGKAQGLSGCTTNVTIARDKVKPS